MPAGEPSAVRRIVRVAVDLVALVLVGLLVWRFLAGTEQLRIGDVTLLSMRNIFRPLRALGALLLFRHLVFGSYRAAARLTALKDASAAGWLFDRPLGAVARSLVAPLFGPLAGIALWMILGALCGGTRAFLWLMTTRHLELTFL
jgi:hypothetical protein